MLFGRPPTIDGETKSSNVEESLGYDRYRALKNGKKGRHASIGN